MDLKGNYHEKYFFIITRKVIKKEGFFMLDIANLIASRASKAPAPKVDPINTLVNKMTIPQLRELCRNAGDQFIRFEKTKPTLAEQFRGAFVCTRAALEGFGIKIEYIENLAKKIGIK